MMTRQQTIDIPADRWLHLELPKASRDWTERKYPGLKGWILHPILKHRVRKNQRLFDTFSGCLKDSTFFEGDSVEIQRKMRDEW
jgi:hypothetical protein